MMQEGMRRPAFRASWRDVAAVGLGLLLIALLRLPAFRIPLDRDEAAYAVMARFILEGETPYIRFYDQKPPGIFYLYAAAQGLLGDSGASIRLLALFAVLATGLGLYALGRWAWGRIGGLASLVLFGFASADPSIQAIQSNTEIFFNAFTVLSLVFVVRGWRHRHVGLLLAGGVLAGTALAIKPVVAPAIAVTAAASWQRCGRGRSGTLGLGLFLVGALLPGTLLALLLLPSGALQASLGLSGSMGRYLGDGVRLWWGGQHWRFVAGPTLRGTWPLWVLGLAGAAAACRLGRLEPRWLIPVWVAAHVVGIISILGRYPHYFLQILPGLALLGAAALAWAARFHRWAPAMLIPLAVLPTVVNQWPYLSGLEQAPPSYEFEPYQHVSPELTSLVHELSRPDEPILVLEDSTEIYFYADRMPAIRYPMSFLIDLSAACAAVRDGLDAAPPALAVYQGKPRPVWHAEGGAEPGCDLVGWAQGQGYVFAGRTDAGEIYVSPAKAEELQLDGPEFGRLLTAAEVPGNAVPLATFGDVLSLLEANWDPGGGLTQYWRCLGPSERDYTVFVHVLSEEGAILWQTDSYPLAGTLPTSECGRGTTFREVATVEAGCGPERVVIGAYFWETLERLPARDAMERPLPENVWSQQVVPPTGCS